MNSTGPMALDSTRTAIWWSLTPRTAESRDTRPTASTWADSAAFGATRRASSTCPGESMWTSSVIYMSLTGAMTGYRYSTAEGELKNVIGKQGSGDGEFNRPTGVAVDAHGDIYVSDWGNNRVLMFNSEGKYIWSFAGDASLSRVARNYMLTNAVSNRLREMGRLEEEKYLRRPRSVRIDEEFRLFIPDYESYRIQIYQKDAIELDRTQFCRAAQECDAGSHLVCGSHLINASSSVAGGH